MTDIGRNIKEALYFQLHHWVGIDSGREYHWMLEQDRRVISKETVRQQLIQLFDHCKDNTPYYAELIAQRGDSYRQDPEAYLADFPVLTKELIRNNFDRLKSIDLSQRKWRYNTSGGSTGEPVKFIQDNAYLARIGALQWLSHDWAGRRFGEYGVRVWGSSDDILKNTVGLRMKLINTLTNDTWFNAFRMTPENMREYIARLNARPPALIMAYAQAIYELAQFAEKEGLEVKPQAAILTSAGTLYPFMRQKLEAVFHCPVFNRYGSREVGDIACECKEHNGLHVFPWGSYVEVIGEEGTRVPDGTEGNILVTSLANYAMPLIRYSIGDRGALSPQQECACGRNGSILERISGRNVDTFKKQDGTLIDGEYFTHLLYFRSWVDKFQIIQNSYTSILFRVQKEDSLPAPGEDLRDIAAQTKALMGEECDVQFEFVKEIPPLASGKYRYTISKVEKVQHELDEVL